jgi:hypothetical protein
MAISVKTGSTSVNVTAIKVGTKSVKDVKVGTKHIWCVPPTSVYYNIIREGTSGNYKYYIDCYFNNNSGQTVTFEGTTPSATGTVTETVTANNTGHFTFYAGLVQPLTNKSVTVTCTYLNNTQRLLFSYNQTITRV